MSNYQPPQKTLDEWLKEHAGQPVIVAQEPGRQDSYWEDPRNVAIYYHVARTAVDKAQLPEWMDETTLEDLTTAYNYFQFKNPGKSWYDWTRLADDDPARPYLQAMLPPPDQYLKPGEERYASDPNMVAGEAEEEAQLTGTYVPGMQGQQMEYWQTQQQQEKATGTYQPGGQGQEMGAYSKLNLSQYKVPEQSSAIGLSSINKVVGGALDVSKVPIESINIDGVQKPLYQQLNQSIVPEGATATAVNEEKLPWYDYRKITSALFGQGNALSTAATGAVIGGATAGIPGAVGGGAFGLVLGLLAPYYPTLASALMILNRPAEEAEKSLGVLSLLMQAPSSPDKMALAKVVTNMDAAMQAGRLTYETAFTDSEQKPYKLMYGPQGWYEEPNTTQRSYWGGPGSNVVWTLPQEMTGDRALYEAFIRIVDNKEDPDQVYQDISRRFGYGALTRDMLMQSIIDPLNYVGEIGKMGSYGYARLTGNKILAEASLVARGPSKIPTTYRELLRFRLSEAEAALLPVGTRRWAGIDAAGKLIEYSQPQARIAQPKAALDILETIGNLFERTPESRATEAVGKSWDMFKNLLAGVDDVDELVRRAEMMSNNRVELASDLSMKYLSSPEGAVLPLFYGKFTKTMRDMVTVFKANKVRIDLLENLSKVLDRDIPSILRELDSTKNAETLLSAYIEKAKLKGGDAAAEIIRAYEAHELTGAMLQELTKTFVKDKVPYSIDLLKADIFAAGTEMASKQAAEWYGVKPTPSMIKLSNAVKSFQSLLLLQTPTYVLNNAIDNFAKLTFDGLIDLAALKPGGALKFFTERVGFTPTRIKAGLGAAAEGIDVNLEPIRSAMRSKGKIQSIEDFASRLSRKLGLFSNLGQKNEQAASAMAMMSGYKKGWAVFHRAPRLDAELARQLRAIDPSGGIEDAVISAVQNGMNQGEVEANLWGGVALRNFDSILPGVAQAAGIDTVRARDILMAHGVDEYLRDNLHSGMKPAEIANVFRELDRKIVDSINQDWTARMRDTAEKVKTRINVEGLSAAFETGDMMMWEYIEHWQRHAVEMDDLFSKAAEIEDTGQRDAYVSARLQQSQEAWNRLARKQEAQMVGITEGLGTESEIARRMLSDLENNHANWETFYHLREALFGQYRRKEITFDDFQSAMNEQYKITFDEQEIYLDDLYKLWGEQYIQQFGEAARPAVDSWVKGIKDTRGKMHQKMSDYREKLKNPPPGETVPTWAVFWQDDYMPDMARLLDEHRRGAAAIYAAGGVEPPPTRPAPEVPRVGGEAGWKEGGTIDNDLRALGLTDEQIKGMSIDEKRRALSQRQRPAQPEQPAPAAEPGAPEPAAETAEIDQTLARAEAAVSSRESIRQRAIEQEERIKRFNAEIDALAAELGITRTPLPEEVATKKYGTVNYMPREAVDVAVNEYGFQTVDAGIQVPGAEAHLVNIVKEFGGPEAKLIEDPGQITPEMVRQAFETRKRVQEAQAKAPEPVKVVDPEAEAEAEKQRFVMERQAAAAGPWKDLPDYIVDELELHLAMMEAELQATLGIGSQGHNIIEQDPVTGALQVTGRIPGRPRGARLPWWEAAGYDREACLNAIDKIGRSRGEARDVGNGVYIGRMIDEMIGRAFGRTEEEWGAPPDPRVSLWFGNEQEAAIIWGDQGFPELKDVDQATQERMFQYYTEYQYGKDEVKPLLADEPTPQEVTDWRAQVKQEEIDAYFQQRKRQVQEIEKIKANYRKWSARLDEPLQLQAGDVRDTFYKGMVDIAGIPKAQADELLLVMDSHARTFANLMRKYGHEYSEADWWRDNIGGVTQGGWESGLYELGRADLEEIRQTYRARTPAPEWIEQAVAYYGLTDNPQDAGYILPDGRMLDLKKSRPTEQLDHGVSITEAVPDLAPEYGSYFEYGKFAHRTGAVRVSLDQGFVNFMTTPTRAQLDIIESALDGKSLTWELSDQNGYRIDGGWINPVQAGDLEPIRGYIRQVLEGQGEVRRPEMLFQGGGTNTQTHEFKDWFRNSKVVDETGQPKVMYHGSMRIDRIAKSGKFSKRRATSGPMAYFTDNPDIASSYAMGKQDTSLGDIDSFENMFLFKVPGERREVNLRGLWWSLDDATRDRLRKNLPFIDRKLTEYENNVSELTTRYPVETRTPEQQAEINQLSSEYNTLYDSGKDPLVITGAGGPAGDPRDPRSHWNYVMKREAGGNPIVAAMKVWLEGGDFVGEEYRFLEVLRAAGLDLPLGSARYEGANVEARGVIPVYLSIENPLMVNNIPQAVISALEEAAGKVRRKPAEYGVDPWDKNTQDPRAWVKRVKESPELAFTSVPDWATDVFKKLGYDGINDAGGKYGGTVSAIWIPFGENQVKSLFNKGKWDWSNPKLLYQSDQPWYYSQLQRTIEAIPQEKMSVEQLRALVTKGAKADELKWTGFEQWLDEIKPDPNTYKVETAKTPGGNDIYKVYKNGEYWQAFPDKGQVDRLLNRSKGLVGKQEALEFLESNRVEVREVVLGEPRLKLAWEPYQLASGKRTIRSERVEYGGNTAVIYELYDDPGRTHININGSLWGSNYDYENARYAAESALTGIQKADTRHGTLVLPGGQNYRELLLTLPQIEKPRKPITPTFEQAYDYFKRFISRGYEMDQFEYDTMLQNGFPEGLLKEVGNVTTREEPLYRSSHWNEPNVLAHVRFDDRIDADGKKVLFVEEIQSDWHQAGRERGYTDPAEHAKRMREWEARNPLKDIPEDDQKLFKFIYGFNYTEKTAPYKEKLALKYGGEWLSMYSEYKGWRLEKPEPIIVPSAPFAKTWPLLTMKRVIRWAAENGYDRVAWPTGEMAARIEGHQIIENINAIEYKGGEIRYLEHGSEIWRHAEIEAGKKLEDYVGYDVAQQLKAAQEDSDGWRKIETKDITFGGEKMRWFYDRNLINDVNGYVKQWGAKVGETKIGSDIRKPFIKNRFGEWELFDSGNESIGAYQSWDEAKAALDDYIRTHPETGTQVHSFDITPAMRESAIKGQPLFQSQGMAKAGASFTAEGRMIFHALNAPDISSAVHEVGHLFRRDLYRVAMQTGDNELLSHIQTTERWATLEAERLNKLKAEGKLSAQQRRSFFMDLDASGNQVEMDTIRAVTDDGRWTRAGEEIFARGFERYLADGFAPTTALQAVFDAFKKWLLNIYTSIKGSSIDVQISDAMRRVYDRLLTEDANIAGEAGQMGMFGEKATSAPLLKMQTPEKGGWFKRELSAVQGKIPETLPTVEPENPIKYEVTSRGGELIDTGRIKRIRPPTAGKQYGLVEPGKLRPVVDNKIQTISGRWVDAPPRISKGTKAEIKKLGAWLVKQADAEAKSRGDTWNEMGFSLMKSNALSQGDLDLLNQYLFGETNPMFSDKPDTLLQSSEWFQTAGGPQRLLQNVTVRRTDTPEFRKWFGESKVVDENGEPLRVYHGTKTDNEFMEFFHGSHFGTSVQAEGILNMRRSSNFSGMISNPNERILPVYLKIENPLRATLDLGVWTELTIGDDLIKQGYLDAGEKLKQMYKETEMLLDEVYKYHATSEENLRAYDKFITQRNANIKSVLNEFGFDGIVYGNQWEGVGDSWIIFEPTQVKSVFNRGTWDANDPRILYQSGDGTINEQVTNGPAPRAAEAALGAVDGENPNPPMHEMLNDGYETYVRPLLNGLEREYMKPSATYAKTLKGVQAEIPPETMALLQTYLKKSYGEMADAKLASIRSAEIARDSALLNYNARYGIDNLAQMVFPYEFWFTRSAIQWAMRALDRPSIMANYARIRTLQDRGTSEDEGFPSRLRRKMRIPMPFLPEWMGDSIYIDPLKQIFNFEQYAYPYENLVKQEDQVTRQARYLIEGWIGDNEISEAEGQEALRTQQGPLWEKAFYQTKAELEQDASDPFNLIRSMLGMSLPLQWAIDIIRKKTPGQLPVERLLQAATAGMTPGGVTRRTVGMKETGNQWWDYYIARELANMAGDGTITPEDATRAMTEKQGAAYTAALDRVGKYTSARYWGSALYLDFFPEGEQRQRELQKEFAAAVDSDEEGAVAKFFDEHPEYAARLAMSHWDEPEGMLRNFLISQIWNKYMEAPDLTKKEATAGFGRAFEEQFLDKETRNYDNIDTATLAYWSKTLGNSLPINAPAVAGNLPAIQFSDQQTTQAYQQYMDARDQAFPGLQEYWDWRAQYITDHPELADFLTGKADLDNAPASIQAAYTRYNAERRRKFPVVGQYNAWKDEYLSQHPELIPFLDESGKVVEASEQVQKAYYAYQAERQKRFGARVDEIQSLYFQQPEEGRQAFLAQFPLLQQYWDWKDQYLAQHSEIIPYVISQDNNVYGASADIQKAYYTYKAQKAQMFPGIGDTQDAYFAIQDKNQKKAYLNQHPELTSYWAWRRWFLAQQPQLLPYVVGEDQLAEAYLGEGYQDKYGVGAQVNLADFPTALVSQLTQHYYSGARLGSGALAMLRIIWEKYGKPGKDLNDWIENTLRWNFVKQ